MKGDFAMAAVAAAAVALAAAAGVAEAQSLEGGVSLSFGRAPFLNSDDDDERLSEAGQKLSGWLGADIGDWRVFGDLNLYRRAIGDEVFSAYAPGGAGSLGLHFGRSFGSGYAGAFVGVNRFQGDDAGSRNGYVTGRLWGLEGSYDFGAASVFAQFGRADMVGDNNDSMFVGPFGRIGVSADVDRFTFGIDYEVGRSPDDFEDAGDSGKYRAIGLDVGYRITDRVIATLSYERMNIKANTEDRGYDEFYGLGIRIPLGETGSGRNNLTTSYRPGLAAAWAETLD